MESSYLHVHALRGASGHEILVARVLAPGGQPALNHPWEKAWLSQKPIEWRLEPAFGRISWL